MTLLTRPFIAFHPPDTTVIERSGSGQPVSAQAGFASGYHRSMPDRPRIYGSDTRFRSTLTRQLTRGQDLVDTLVGVKRRMAATDGRNHGLQAMAIEFEWAAAVEKWQKATVRPLLEHLQDGAAALLPELGTGWPPDTGRPRHARKIEWIEPWLIACLNELQQLQALVSPNQVPVGRPVPPRLDDRGLMLAAVKEMHQSFLDETRPLPLVGAVVELPDGSVVGAHRSQLRNGDHAEYTLFERHLHNQLLEGARLFVTLEPCAPGARNKEKTACAERVVNARVREVWIGIPDPYPTVAGRGRDYLESHGLLVNDFDADLQNLIREANTTFMAYAEEAALASRATAPVIEQRD